MRSVVSYDDLEQITTAPAPAPPPAKKRKRQQNKRKSLGLQKFAHWDDPEENLDTFSTNYNYPGDREGEATDVESRELTHEEIWDDSALIEAWDAAMDEYKVCQNLASAIPLTPCRHSMDQRTSGRLNQSRNLLICECDLSLGSAMLSSAQLVQRTSLGF